MRVSYWFIWDRYNCMYVYYRFIWDRYNCMYVYYWFIWDRYFVDAFATKIYKLLLIAIHWSLFVALPWIITQNSFAHHLD